MSADEAGRQRERLLIDSAARINRALERERIYEAIRDLVTSALHAEACSVFLLNRDRDCWEYHVAFNELVKPDKLPPLARGEGLVGWVGLHEKPALINDPLNDPRLRHIREKNLPIPLRSIMAVPLARAGSVIGTLEVINASRPEGFLPEDLELLEALGNQFSIALANARLYEMMRREKRANELLYRVGLALARTLRLVDLLPLLVELLGEMIEFDAVSIYLYDRDSGELEWFHSRGYPEGSEEKVRLKVGQGAVGWVAQQRQAVIIPDVAQDRRYLEARPDTRSEMTVPLLAEEELLGVFNLESNRINAFHNEDLRLLLAFGNQAAIAIQRAWLHTQAIEMRRMEEEIRIARRIQRRLLPAEDPVFAGLDIAAFNHPSLEVSGDVYDFIEITRDQLGVMIGDVSGKGIPAGIVMSAFRASLKAEIRNNYAISVVLAKVNRLMWESIEETAFVTAIYGVYDRVRRRLTYSNAGHDPPFLLRRNGEVEWLREGGMLLGSYPGATYNEAFLDLTPGDRLVLYTDGITEAASPTGEMFGIDRLLTLVRQVDPGQTSRATCRQILDAVHTHCAGTHIEDDLTAIVLRVLPPEAQDARPGG